MGRSRSEDPRHHVPRRGAFGPYQARPESAAEFLDHTAFLALNYDLYKAIHSANFDHLRVSTFPLTAIPTAFFWPTKTSSFLPLVMPV